MASTALSSALAAALLALGCGGSDEAPPPGPAPEPSALPTAQTASGDESPVAGPAVAAGDPARGEALYLTYCASCHGSRGAGDGPAAAGLDPRPAAHSDGTYMNELSDVHLLRVIRDGGAAVGKSPLMVGWGGALSDEQIRDVIAFVRSLADPPYRPGD